MRGKGIGRIHYFSKVLDKKTPLFGVLFVNTGLTRLKYRGSCIYGMDPLCHVIIIRKRLLLSQDVYITMKQKKERYYVGEHRKT